MGDRAAQAAMVELVGQMPNDRRAVYFGVCCCLNDSPKMFDVGAVYSDFAQ